MEFRKALLHDYPALEQMLELYQYELSDIWLQEVDSQGRYGYDLSRHKAGIGFHAYVGIEGACYAGFALVAPARITQTEGCWMEQFFVLKRYRRAGFGRALARYVLSAHPGAWEVGQMPENLAAQAFWRCVIEELTAGRFDELQVTEGWWRGVVQRFHVRPAG